MFVFENNHYSEHTGVDYAVGTNKDIASRAEAFGMKVWRANGSDFFDTYDDDARGARICPCRQRPRRRSSSIPNAFYGHFEGDPQRYRGPGEVVRHARRARLPEGVQRQKVSDAAGLLELADLDAIDAEVADLIEEATSTKPALRRRPIRRTSQPTSMCPIKGRGPMTVMTIRDAINQTIHAEMERNPDVLCLAKTLSAGNGTAGGPEAIGGIWGATGGLYNQVRPDRVIDTPISESAIVGAAAGLRAGRQAPDRRADVCRFRRRQP